MEIVENCFYTPEMIKYSILYYLVSESEKSMNTQKPRFVLCFSMQF